MKPKRKPDPSRLTQKYDYLTPIKPEHKSPISDWSISPVSNQQLQLQSDVYFQSAKTISQRTISKLKSTSSFTLKMQQQITASVLKYNKHLTKIDTQFKLCPETPCKKNLSQIFEQEPSDLQQSDQKQQITPTNEAKKKLSENQQQSSTKLQLPTNSVTYNDNHLDEINEEILAFCYDHSHILSIQQQDILNFIQSIYLKEFCSQYQASIMTQVSKIFQIVESIKSAIFLILVQRIDSHQTIDSESICKQYIQLLTMDIRSVQQPLTCWYELLIEKVCSNVVDDYQTFTDTSLQINIAKIWNSVSDIVESLIQKCLHESQNIQQISSHVMNTIKSHIHSPVYTKHIKSKVYTLILKHLEAIQKKKKHVSKLLPSPMSYATADTKTQDF